MSALADVLTNNHAFSTTFPVWPRLQLLQQHMSCVRMYLSRREVAKDKEQPISQALLDLLDDRISPTCIRTFIVATLTGSVNLRKRHSYKPHI